jgi:Leucine-rich repeat (LRR) protein
MRCHNPGISKLNGIITRIAESEDLDIKMLDWNLPGLDVFTKKVFLTSIQKADNNLHLIGLFVSSNGTLRMIEDGAFLGLRNDIQNLGLSDNNLGPEIPKEIFSLPNLLQLDISRNNISTLRPISNHNTRSLKYLDLSENNLERINDIHVNLFPRNLCTLKVSYNRLTLDGLSGANFAQIGSLDLSHNEISGNLTNSIFNGTGGKHVEKLHLDYNQIRNIGENSFCGLPKLKHLWLSHNNIEGLDKKSFMCLKHLSYINLSHNRILDITKGLFEPLSSSLKELILSNNHLSLVGDSPITSVPLSTLTYLDLQNNDINKIEGKCFQNLPYLETLLLGGKFRPVLR